VSADPNAIPTRSREIVRARSGGKCEWCKVGRAREWHHRRTKKVKGEHRHCPCNGIDLCTTCHQYAHRHPEQAREEGLIVSSFVVLPGTVPVWGIGYFTCDGGVRAV
jgi:hypothetical protein